MAHFRGTIRGARGTESRLGTRNSGLSVEAQSWQGKIVVDLYEKDGTDYARVYFDRHEGRGQTKLIYDGPVDGSEVPLMRVSA